jgi:hypothetical protein
MAEPPAGVLVDSHVLIDVIQRDPIWAGWSGRQLERLAARRGGVINPIVYAEVSAGYQAIESLEAAIAGFDFQRQPLPWDAAFLAGKAYVRYLGRGGVKRSPLADFYIGAHAAVNGMSLLTRDAARYRDYLPRLRLISPPRG